LRIGPGRSHVGNLPTPWELLVKRPRLNAGVKPPNLGLNLLRQVRAALGKPRGDLAVLSYKPLEFARPLNLAHGSLVLGHKAVNLRAKLLEAL